jgi:hypothetical protein
MEFDFRTSFVEKEILRLKSNGKEEDIFALSGREEGVKKRKASDISSDSDSFSSQDKAKKTIKNKNKHKKEKKHKKDKKEKREKKDHQHRKKENTKKSSDPDGSV